MIRKILEVRRGIPNSIEIKVNNEAIKLYLFTLQFKKSLVRWFGSRGQVIINNKKIYEYTTIPNFFVHNFLKNYPLTLIFLVKRTEEFSKGYIRVDIRT